VNLAESITKNSKLALTRAKLRSMHSELSYGLSFAPKLQRVAVIDLSGSHQPTPDPSFSLDIQARRPETLFFSRTLLFGTRYPSVALWPVI